MSDYAIDCKCAHKECHFREGHCAAELGLANDRLKRELEEANKRIVKVRQFVLDDHLAMTFQTLKQYRTAVLEITQAAKEARECGELQETKLHNECQALVGHFLGVARPGGERN